MKECGRIKRELEVSVSFVLESRENVTGWPVNSRVKFLVGLVVDESSCISDLVFEFYLSMSLVAPGLDVCPR